MHKLVTLSDAERRRIIHQFIDEAFGDLDANPDLVALLRSAMPALPDDSTPEQVDAWIENGWPTPPTLAPVFEWFIQALQHHPDPMTTPA